MSPWLCGSGSLLSFTYCPVLVVLLVAFYPCASLASVLPVCYPSSFVVRRGFRGALLWVGFFLIDPALESAAPGCSLYFACSCLAAGTSAGCHFVLFLHLVASFLGFGVLRLDSCFSCCSRASLCSLSACLPCAPICVVMVAHRSFLSFLALWCWSGPESFAVLIYLCCCCYGS